MLRELFQIERAAELDFGIYRIMGRKRSEVERFIDHRLPEIVDEALKGGAVSRQAEQAEELRKITDRIKENFGEYAISPYGELNEGFHETPLGKQYLALRKEAGDVPDREQLKATIFNHLYTFFSRYYEGGDFLSRRRYSKRQKYAIPYNGEEVYLHWANADQYYVKTGEHFNDYSYRVKGNTVRFETVAADTERDNVKGDKRYFIPHPKDAAFDGETLTVPFEWRPLTNKEEKSLGGSRNQAQRQINERAVAEITNRFRDEPAASVALDAEALARHLRRYTARNTQDFFIHKDLRGFLEGELDFYLKNEVLDIDDLERWGPDLSESWFEVMRAIKGIGRRIIAFLAQIEDFQKRLFEKKKFVVSCSYCLTLDRVPEELYPEVARNDAQYEEWERLFAISGIEATLENTGNPRSVEWLKANPHLVLDTRFFDEDFKDRLLSGIKDLDEQTEGLLIRSENFQALNLLQERYREQVKCVYIDPPYNTGNDGFLYKDSYQHSSWLTMMDNRLRLTQPILPTIGAIFVSIDEHELHNLKMLLSNLFKEENFVGDFVWQSKKGGGGDVGTVVADHEYVPCFRKANSPYALSKSMGEAEQLDLTDEKGKYRRGRELNKWGAGSRREDRPTMYFPIPGPDGEDVYPFRNDGTEGRWRWGKKRMLEIVERGDVDFVKRPNGTYIAYEKVRSEDPHPRPYRTWMTDVKTTADGSKAVREIFGGKAYDFPKPVELLKHLIAIGINDNEQLVLDFFAGSGTTGHAVINLNREDGGRRKYILVEMGEYFDTVMKPRIMKVIHSKDWRDGKPVSREGVSHTFKYMTLESYEDTLNNIAFTGRQESQAAMALYGDDYLLRYMLDFETRDSGTLLSVKQMSAPFDYRLTVREGGESRELRVNLPETFAYLLGMRVASRRAYSDSGRRYLVYRGSTREREDVAVIWRSTEGWKEDDYERDRAFVEEQKMAEGAQDVFVNGDSLIEGARPLEATFKRLMLPEQG